MVKIEVNSAEFKPYIQIVDINKNGTVVSSNYYTDENSSSDNTSYVIFSPVSDAKYNVRVKSDKDESKKDSINEPLNYDIKVSSTSNLEISAEGSKISGELNSNDLISSIPHTNVHGGTYYKELYTDNYLLTDVKAGQPIKITLDSNDFNTQLVLINTDTQEIIYSSSKLDDINNSSQLKFIPVDGINYTIRVSSYGDKYIGSYEVETENIIIPAISLTSSSNNINGEVTAEDIINPNPININVTSYSDEYKITDFESGKTYRFSLFDDN